MNLKKIDRNTAEEIKSTGKKAICYVKVPEYIHEMNKEFGLLSMIDFILEEHEKRLGNCECDGISIPVYNVSRLDDIDWEQYILIITSEYYKEVFEKLQDNEKIAKGMSTIYYYADAEIEYYDYYAELYRKEALENIIVFRSGPRKEIIQKGMDFDDNARALFDYMIKNGFNQKYELVWFVKYPVEFSEYVDCIHVKFIPIDWAVSDNQEEREAYYHSLFLSKYIFFTNTFSFARNVRAEQIRVQLWHGQGFKGRAIFSSFENRCEYMTVMSEFYAEIHEKAFGLKKQQMLITGNPKQDWIFHKVGQNTLCLLKIPRASKYIFWLPTFRKIIREWKALDADVDISITGMPVIDDFKQVDRLNDILKKNELVLVIKPHPLQDRSQIKDIERTNIVLLDHISLVQNNLHINQLLGYADALISDYSSVAVDYLLLDRPLAFAIEDIEEYRKSRAFHFDNIEEWLPGKMLFTFEDLCDFVNEIAEGVDSSYDRRQMISAKMCKWKDDRNCERVLEALGIKKDV